MSMSLPTDTERYAASALSRSAAAPAAASDAEERTSILSILALLLRERRTVVTALLLSLVTALAVVLMKTRMYTTSFSFVPQAAQDQSRAGLASLAGQLGVSIGAAAGGAQSPQLYADLLRTRETLEPILRDSFALRTGGPRVPLVSFLRIDGDGSGVILDRALKALRSRIYSSVALRTTGMVTVSVSTADPSVSLSIAERLVKGVNDFNLRTRRSQAGEERRFTEGRLVEARGTLRVAEDALQAFLVANRQYSNSPQLEFERNRLERDLGLKQQLVNGLAQSFEEARIREVRDTPVISIIEGPALAALPDGRGGAVIMAAGAALGLLVGILGALLRDTLRRFRESPNDPDVSRLVSEWRRFRSDRHAS
jgi:uncharacterized protein involved in exopolysaccharide biosynthesis